MKHSLILILSFSFALSAFGQQDLTIADFTFNGYHISDSLSQESYNKLKGKADSVKYDTSANYIENETAMYFKKSVVWFYYKSTRIANFEFYDNFFDFKLKSVPIKVGDAVTGVKHLFSKAYAKKYQSGEIKDTIVNIYINDYEGLLFHVYSNKIKGIEYWVDND